MKNIASRFQAAPDGLLAAVLLSVLATAGFYYVNIMPALVDGLKVGLHFSDRAAGLAGSANVYGAAVGALAATFLVARWPWRRTAVVLLLALIACDLTSIFVTESSTMIAVRALHGLAGGTLVGFSYAIFARTRNPERVFGMLLVVQGGLGGLGVMALPQLVPMFGTRALFLSLAAFSIAALASMPFLAPYPPRTRGGPGPQAEAREQLAAARVPAGRLLLALALLATFLFQFANMLLFTYIIGLAKHFGLEPLHAATVVGVSTWIGMLGSALVVVFGTRFGRLRSLTATLLLTAVGMWVLHHSDNALVFAAANVGTSITWSFVIAHLLGMCARCDLDGVSAALGGFASKMGLATGPFAGALLLHGNRYDLLINMATAGIIACTVATFLPAQRLDRLDEQLGSLADSQSPGS